MDNPFNARNFYHWKKLGDELKHIMLYWDKISDTISTRYTLNSPMNNHKLNSMTFMAIQSSLEGLMCANILMADFTHDELTSVFYCDYDMEIETGNMTEREIINYTVNKTRDYSNFIQTIILDNSVVDKFQKKQELQKNIEYHEKRIERFLNLIANHNTKGLRKKHIHCPIIV
tara:strand:- start:203 stop:721 length:519 start_codon:yes stop_codon:yes gene_type:complete